MKETLVKVFGKMSLTLRKHAPEILVVSGTIGLITAGVIACTETTKLDEVLKKGEERKEELADKLNRLDDLIDKLPEEEKKDYTLSETEENSEVARVWIKNAFDVAKLYAPSIILAIASTSSILGGFGILKARHVAVVAAFGEMSAAFAEFKKRTQAAVGDEKYREILDGVKKEMKEVIDDKGTPIVAEVDTVDPVKDPYTFIWDETTTKESGAYKLGDFAFNEAFLRGVEQAVNNKLRNLTGYIFLNEVLEDLGLPKTKAGQEVGWVMNPGDGHTGDDYIDFGIEVVDDVNKETMKITRRYILHFNCDGYILDTFEHAWEGEK